MGDQKQRRIELLDMARRDRMVSVAAAAAAMGVAPETIRRDLAALSEKGFLERVHGGARPMAGSQDEPTLEQRYSQDLPEKRRIAAEVVRRVANVQTIYLDEGHTPTLVAELLPDSRELTVFTACLPAALILARKSAITTRLLGGEVRSATLSVAGPDAEDALAAVHIDLAVIGSNRISPAHGLTTPVPQVSRLKAAAMRVSDEVLFLGVSTKWHGRRATYRFAGVGDLTTIVTDKRLRLASAWECEQLGPTVVRV